MTIAYDAILDAIVTLLTDAPDLATAHILPEPTEIGIRGTLEVGVYLTGEENVEAVMGAPDPYDTTLTFRILCAAYSPDGVRDAIKRRGTLVNAVRNALKADRSLGGALPAGLTQLGGIEFESAKTEAGYFAAANLDLRVILRA